MLLYQFGYGKIQWQQINGLQKKMTLPGTKYDPVILQMIIRIFALYHWKNQVLASCKLTYYFEQFE